ncbi:transposase InsO family protein [Erythromicrobium ramosum]|uniref:Transposase InsO family protein n=1 Tax=Erythrobacter ramosus TaxID=35811 RepID=A0ABR6HXN1_9SPHN|nr:transposase InsO family protein [Erythrobacter ramosus]
MMPVSERRVCRVLGQHRSTQRKTPRGADDEASLTEDIIALARQYGRYGYRRVAALLREAGWHVNRKRVERIWRREGLKVPQKQPKRGRFWLNDGSCIRLRPEYPGHVWSYDFVEDRTHDGRKFRILSIIDEASRECLALPVGRWLRSEDVLAALAELFVTRGPPAHIRSDNGPEFIANAVQQWLARIGVKTLYITPGSPGNGDTAMAALRFRFAPPAASHGAGGNLALTINTDHSVRAGHVEGTGHARFHWAADYAKHFVIKAVFWATSDASLRLPDLAPDQRREAEPGRKHDQVRPAPWP